MNEVLRSPGQPLDKETRAFFEPRFGHDFSKVRVHTDAKAAESASAVNALAYTVGNHIVCGENLFWGCAAKNKHVAHELAHVAQNKYNAGSVGADRISSKADQSEREANQAGEQALAGASPVQFHAQTPALCRYSHQDCSEADLRNVVWPADWIARQMTDKALNAVSATPLYQAQSRDRQATCVKRLGGCPNTRPAGIPTPEEIASYNAECKKETNYQGSDVTPTSEECSADTIATPAHGSTVDDLFLKYFRTRTPDAAKIHSVYQTIQNTFSANRYQYECENDCSGSDLGYVYGIWSDIHLCLNHIRNWPTACVARTIVHEFSHYYAGTGDKAYCKSGCAYDRCPEKLTPAEALNNADSYACFAYELYPRA